MANDVIQTQLKAAIDAAKAGNKVVARQLLEKVLEKDENNETAWMWMAMVVETPRDKRVCLEQVLEINPNNQRAREALERIQPGATAAYPVSPPPQPSSREATDNLRPSSGATSARPTSRAPSAQRSQQRRLFTTPFLLGIGGALGMIVFGFLMLSNTPPAIVSTPTVDPATITAQALAAIPTNNSGTLAPIQAPVNATIVTLEPVTPLPTLTPSPSYTPAIETSPAPTLPAVESYKIAFVGEGRGDGKQAIYSVGGNGAKETLLTNGNSSAYDVAISKEGRMAYVSIVEGIPQLFIANANGRNEQQITQLQGQNLGSPSWGPDGKRIAFYSDDSGNNEIYIINDDGSDLTNITENKVDDRAPAWSPNNDLIVYASDPTGKNAFQLFEYSMFDHKSKQITTSAGSNYAPAWKPDGTAIAFISTRDRYADVYVMEMHGTVRSPLLVTYSDGSAEYRDPNWTPDGRYLVFASKRDGDEVFNLYMMTPDAKVLAKITQHKEKGQDSYRAYVIQ